MFDLPDAKRVRREDLYDDASASEHEVSQDEQVENELRRKLDAQLSGLLHFEFSPTEAAAQQPRDTKSNGQREETQLVTVEEPEEVAFEFRLFRDETPTHTVVIQQNDERASGAGEGGFVIPKRPSSYYVAEEPDQHAVERFKLTALNSDYIIENAKMRHWGLETPWKVTHISLKIRHPDPNSGRKEAEPMEGKRKRPGKKRRIILRTREKARKEKEEAANKHLVDKEEHLREKKKRLNREKKLKRRAKEKEKKAAETGAPEEVADE
ncbi:hypothetical protein BJ170DRAFT_113556 [Xylariales sp. AK1849]|nr:hypothetical protein BJ170DRAFT_113556 [Xylariales sp. AK1849]